MKKKNEIALEKVLKGNKVKNLKRQLLRCDLIRVGWTAHQHLGRHYILGFKPFIRVQHCAWWVLIQITAWSAKCSDYLEMFIQT